MSRPLRLEFPGAIYHVTSRGDRRESIYRDDDDRLAQLAVIGQAMDRFDAQVLAFCQMDNHFHLVLHTRRANLSRTMRHINGVYTQQFNRRHGLAGHLFQGRFKAILVDRDAHLLALCRHVEGNPVAAGLVGDAGDWPWSSYAAHVRAAAAPDWLDTDGLHGYLLGHAVQTDKDRAKAAKRYAALVQKQSTDGPTFWADHLRHQVFLGDDDFVRCMLDKTTAAQRANTQIPKAQRHPQIKISLQEYMQQHYNQPAALAAAYRDGAMTMSAMAKALKISVPTVSRWIAASEGGRNK
jgi:putative transposase